MFCDTCGHRGSDICGGCESLEGVPVKYTEKGSKPIVPIFGTCVFKEHCAVAGCSRYEKRLKLTNAERIRNMTDEELAEFIAIQHTECCYCKIVTDCFEQNDGDCSKAWLEWLKQEVSDDS